MQYGVNNGLNVIFLQMAILYIIFLNAMFTPVIWDNFQSYARFLYVFESISGLS